MALPIGAVVRHRQFGDLGTVVRGPHRASRGMAWVAWESRDSVPVLTQTWWLAYVAHRRKPTPPNQNPRMPLDVPPR